ncbi:Frag1/DRAM/Sfk1 [Phaffia rhodozyma]|uniref:Frag1/DRAM/Sfk1 n=1 Tax=Phaffia rhodozyma TaxID=264483 RepID=A0A0F7SHY3_PHARH|nr:Frag1/DRAM/Sfk1 [Phaffia rhodozyma]
MLSRPTNSAGEKKPFLFHTAYGQYWIFPLLSALVWLAGLIALVSLWAVSGTPRYQEDSADIQFISDIGGIYQKLFIGICVVTAALYVLSLFAERWLRHVDRIPGHGQRNKLIVIFDILAIIFGILGAAALIVLSAFNTYNYSTVHWTSTCVFILCVAISAVFQSLEIFYLKKGHPDRPHLMRNSVLKMLVVIAAISVAITFGVLYSICSGGVDYSASPSAITRCNRITGAAAICEWTVALIFDAYLFTLLLDLWPASKTSPRYLRRLERWEQSSLEKMGVAAGMDSRTSYAPTTETRTGMGTPVEGHQVTNGVVAPRFQESPQMKQVVPVTQPQGYEYGFVQNGYAQSGTYPTTTYPGPTSAPTNANTDAVVSRDAVGYENTELPLGAPLTTRD